MGHFAEWTKKLSFHTGVPDENHNSGSFIQAFNHLHFYKAGQSRHQRKPETGSHAGRPQVASGLLSGPLAAREVRLAMGTPVQADFIMWCLTDLRNADIQSGISKKKRVIRNESEDKMEAEEEQQEKDDEEDDEDTNEDDGEGEEEEDE
ncbi:hypothetical protein BDR26DRAFT_942830 [Obelidium mucronatum]|nr:hypothetical protein BDR26DRAFT_942830 [Obelidium mucronatum]